MDQHRIYSTPVYLLPADIAEVERLFAERMQPAPEPQRKPAPRKHLSFPEVSVLILALGIVAFAVSRA